MLSSELQRAAFPSLEMRLGVSGWVGVGDPVRRLQEEESSIRFFVA